MTWLVELLQRLPKQTRAVVQTCLYGLAAGVATVAFQLGMNWLYRAGLVNPHDLLRAQASVAQQTQVEA